MSNGATTMVNALVRKLIQFRLVVLVALVFCTVVAGNLAGRVGVDNAVEVWFLEDDPALLRYQQFQDSFGNDEVIVMAVSPDSGVLSGSGLSVVQEVDERLQGIEGLADVQSVTASVGVGGDMLALDVGPAVSGDVATDPVAARRAVERITGDPLLSRLVSSDGAVALVLARMAPMEDVDARREGILQDVRSALHDVDARVAYGGIGVIYAALNEASTQGAAVFIAASYLLIAVLLWWLFGRVGPTMLTLLAVGAGVVVLMGMYGLADRDINMVTMVLPTLVLVIGVSSCVHMLTHVSAQDIAKTPTQRTVDGVSFVFWPCLINTLTTCMGFLALTTAAMPVIRDLGVFGALGLAVSFLTGLLLCATLSSWPFFQPICRDRGWLQRAVDAVANVAVHRSRVVLVGAAFAGLIAALGITRIEVDTWSIGFLRADHPVRQDSDFIEARFGPYTPLEFTVHAEDTVRTPEVFAAMATWQDRMAQQGDVGWSRSAADGVRRLQQVMTDGGAQQYRVPADPDAFEQLLFVYSAHPDSDVHQLMSADERTARVSVGIPMGSARSFQNTMNELQALAEFPPGVTVETSGYLPLYVQMMDYIVRSQLSSFGAAFLIIFTLIGVLFRSLRMAVLSVPANLLPVVFTLGVMGLLQIRLDVATVTIAAIVLGLVVDDTVQLLYRYQHERSRHASEAEAVHAAIRGVGRPMAMTTIVLSLGFCVLGLATVKSVAYFGLLLATALLTALFSDLLVIPALLVELDAAREGPSQAVRTR